MTASRAMKDMEEQLCSCRERVLIAKLRPRFWLSRLIVAVQVFVQFVLVAALEPDSLAGRSIVATDGLPLVLALGACCLLCIFDVIVNDILPDGFVLPTAIEWRHAALMGMALFLAMMGIFVSSGRDSFTMLLVAYWLNAALCAALAYIDTFTRLGRK